jgi:three-Cys-motif partner protein
LSKRNDDFFKEKKQWSRIKDELLSCYLTPYFAKILKTYKPLVYVDCLAGKGKFENGENGSPMIALEKINECMENTSVSTPKVTAWFIDLNYADDLIRNLPDVSYRKIISGAYEDKIETILADKKGCNVFLYIDPYGIKALQYSLLKRFALSNFNSIELLLNLNSFGFIRESCHALGVEYTEIAPDFFEDLIEYEPTQMDFSQKSVKDLIEIAGGDYWVKIIEDYKSNKYDGYQAEKLFAEQYCKKLQEEYKYVLNMPLRLRKGQRPKYRMIYATQHSDGCILMAENIYHQWQFVQSLQSDGQKELWDQDSDNNIIDYEKLESYLKVHISSYKQKTQFNIFLADFYVNFGPFYSPRDIKTIIKRFEKEGKISVERFPEKTETGRESTFLDFDNKKQAYIRGLL